MVYGWIFGHFTQTFRQKLMIFLLTLYFHHRSASAPRYIDWMPSDDIAPIAGGGGGGGAGE